MSKSDLMVALAAAAPLLMFGVIGLIGPFIKAALIYDRQYDRMVNAVIRGGMIELVGEHTVKAGLLTIWVSNYPYGYGHPYDCGISQKLTLAPWTKRRLRAHVHALSTLRALEKVRGAA